MGDKLTIETRRNGPPGGRSRVFQDGYTGVKIRLFTLGRADISISIGALMVVIAAVLMGRRMIWR